MDKPQTLEDFYNFKFDKVPLDIHKDSDHFNVFRTVDYNNNEKKKAPYSRRDFYKISLIRGDHLFHYADKTLKVSGTTLMFFNPMVPYLLESISEANTGFFCIFTKHFFTETAQGGIKQLPMFAPGGKPAFFLNDEQDRRLSDIYERMLLEIGSDYAFKYDLLRNYVTEMAHFALKLKPSEELYQHPNAKQRITAVFTELLERQFPIENPGQRLNLRSARDFAEQLAVHVNHLNRAIKDTTGKTTTDLIAERLVSEAKKLLKHTDWNIAEVGYCLGFDDPAHFNNYFKKLAYSSPSAFRAS
ncbi:MAG: AraC family transcriptional regulator [Bacteroidota bacterium]|nr:AraC family transcriptional regulator [Bacteroidota bacterium]